MRYGVRREKKSHETRNSNSFPTPVGNERMARTGGGQKTQHGLAGDPRNTRGKIRHATREMIGRKKGVATRMQRKRIATSRKSHCGVTIGVVPSGSLRSEERRV